LVYVLAIADPPSIDVLSQPPRDPKENVINRESLLRLAIVAPAMAVAALAAFFLESKKRQRQGADDGVCDFGS
jgi:magnesium-transporting ATPase (P-type)